MNKVCNSHDKWKVLSDEDINKYIDKYYTPYAPGKCSSRRRKKIKFLRGVLDKRERTLRLIAGII